MSEEFVHVFSSESFDQLAKNPGMCAILYDCLNDVELEAYIIRAFKVM